MEYWTDTPAVGVTVVFLIMQKVLALPQYNYTVEKNVNPRYPSKAKKALIKILVHSRTDKISQHYLLHGLTLR